MASTASGPRRWRHVLDDEEAGALHHRVTPVVNDGALQVYLLAAHDLGDVGLHQVRPVRENRPAIVDAQIRGEDARLRVHALGHLLHVHREAIHVIEQRREETTVEKLRVAAHFVTTSCEGPHPRLAPHLVFLHVIIDQLLVLLAVPDSHLLDAASAPEGLLDEPLACAVLYRLAVRQIYLLLRMKPPRPGVKVDVGLMA
mmetsp:Transcript_60805/g.156716  ORF Transcript_60805/g.156716 Transcript_60805/m.156716 type:complete len:200 (+) Transcript_60805:121-720(+)